MIAHPTVFVASSTEGLHFARAVGLHLSAVAHVRVWADDPGLVDLSSTLIELLERAAAEADFAVIIVTEDDILVSRGTESRTPRGNVLLELGLFIGAIGRRRTFLLYGGTGAPQLPSDLGGVVFSQFDAKVEPSYSLTRSCAFIRRQLEALGPKGGRLAAQKWISLMGSPTPIIDSDSERRLAYNRFWRQFVLEIERIPFGINTCAPEPLRSIFFDLAAERLHSWTDDQLRDFAQHVCFIWRRGGTAGINYAPPLFSNVEVRSALERRFIEALRSDVVVAIAGRTGTFSALQELWDYHHSAPQKIDLKTKRLVLVGWFGGAALEFHKKVRNSDLVAKASPFMPTLDEEFNGWWHNDIPLKLARSLAIFIEHQLRDTTADR
jgi:Predicted nucleotide-binding protein containing TIR-like domain